jgi:hypothetical protein
MLPPDRLLVGSIASTATRCPPAQVHAQGVDEGALAHARHPGDPDRRGLAGEGQQPLEQFLAVAS